MTNWVSVSAGACLCAPVVCMDYSWCLYQYASVQTCMEKERERCRMWLRFQPCHQWKTTRSSPSMHVCITSLSIIECSLCCTARSYVCAHEGPHLSVYTGRDNRKCSINHASASCPTVIKNSWRGPVKGGGGTGMFSLLLCRFSVIKCFFYFIVYATAFFLCVQNVCFWELLCVVF